MFIVDGCKGWPNLLALCGQASTTSSKTYIHRCGRVGTSLGIKAHFVCVMNIHNTNGMDWPELRQNMSRCGLLIKGLLKLID